MCVVQFHHFPQLIPRQLLQREGPHRLPRVERFHRSGPLNTSGSTIVSVSTQIFCVPVTEGSFCPLVQACVIVSEPSCFVV